jgi:putative ABC transport system permease protein
MALGAASGQVLRSVMAGALALIAVGLAVGCATAVVLGRTVASFLYGVSATDPAIFAGSVTVLTLAGVAAAFVPARRASRVDPMTALRYE